MKSATALVASHGSPLTRNASNPTVEVIAAVVDSHQPVHWSKPRTESTCRTAPHKRPRVLFIPDRIQRSQTADNGLTRNSISRFAEVLTHSRGSALLSLQEDPLYGERNESGRPLRRPAASIPMPGAASPGRQRGQGRPLFDRRRLQTSRRAMMLIGTVVSRCTTTRITMRTGYHPHGTSTQLVGEPTKGTGQSFALTVRQDWPTLR
jgi:hypothetical protein